MCMTFVLPLPMGDVFLFVGSLRMQIRMVGEAPFDIRKAWVGLVLPLAPGETGARCLPTVGVYTAPRTYLGYL